MLELLFQGLPWLSTLVCFLSGLLVIRRPFRVSAIFLSCGFIFYALLTYFELQATAYPADFLYWKKYIVFFESLMVVCCYFYTKTSFRNNSYIHQGFGFWVAIVVSILTLTYTFIVSPHELIYSPDFSEENILFLSNQGFSFYLILMVFLVFGLVQLERTMVALHQLQRWQIKLEIVGVGLMMAAFALYFSHSLLYRSINMSYLVPRSIVVLLAAGLVVYSRFFRGEGSNLALSRGIAYRSFVLLIVGGYLILLGVIGEGLSYLNISNAKNIFYVFMLIAGLGLAGVFLSETLRRRLRVLLHKNFYQSKYDYREQWEGFTKKISNATSLHEMQVSILDLLCTTYACKWAVFYLLDVEKNVYINTACFNFSGDWQPVLLEDSLIVKLQQKDWIVNLAEDNSELSGPWSDPHINEGAFLIVPLFFDEELTGFIVVGEQIDRGEELTYEDYDLLRMQARQTITTVQGQRLTEQLSTARELAAIGKVSTFVLHDLKNQVSGLSLMLDNARSYLDNPEFQQDMLETVGNTVRNMNELIAKLKNLKEKPDLIVKPVDLSNVIRDAVDAAGGNIEVIGDAVDATVDDEEIYKVVLNLLVNAAEATSNGEPIKVAYGARENSAFVEVSDSGCGMSLDFVKNHLFHPFKTTKKNGFGIGLYQCRQIVESHHGSISVESKVGEGTTFEILLPLTLDE